MPGRAVELRAGALRRPVGEIARAERWKLGAGAALVAVGLLVFWLGHGLTFRQDDWSFIYTRLGGTADVYLEPHNEHLALVPVALYKALFATVGIAVYWPYRVMVVVAHLLCVVLLFLVARGRVGSRGAVIVVLPFLFLGVAWEVVLWPFNVAFAVSVAAFLGLLLLLDRREPVAEAACAVLLALAIASSSLGLAMAAGVAVEILWQRDRWRRIWIPALPLALYGLWFLGYNRHPAYQGPRDFTPSPRHVFEAAAGAVGAVLGVSLDNRIPRLLTGVVELLTAAAMATVAWLAVIRKRLSPRLAMLLVVAGGNWVALAVTRSFVDPWESRYVYGGAFLVVLIGLELARGWKPRRHTAVALAVAACVACLLNLGWLIRNADSRREEATREAAVLTALELSREVVDASFRPRPEPPTEVLVAGSYFNAIDAFGESPAMSLDELSASPEYALAAADGVLLRALQPSLVPYVGDAKEFIDSVARSSARRDRRADKRPSCSVAVPRGGAPARLDMVLPRTGLVLRARPPAAAAVRLRRFAGAFPDTPLGVVSREPTYLTASRGRSRRPWRVEISSVGRVEACRLRV